MEANFKINKYQNSDSEIQKISSYKLPVLLVLDEASFLVETKASYKGDGHSRTLFHLLRRNSSRKQSKITHRGHIVADTTSKLANFAPVLDQEVPQMRGKLIGTEIINIQPNFLKWRKLKLCQDYQTIS
jgi:hypothetical protein